jgi:hypothetical protein
MMDRKMKNYSVADVAAANKRFYEKYPGCKEDAAMLKKAMQINHTYRIENIG